MKFTKQSRCSATIKVYFSIGCLRGSAGYTSDSWFRLRSWSHCFVSLSPVSGSALTVWSLLGTLSHPFSLPLPHSCCFCLSQKSINKLKKRVYFSIFRIYIHIYMFYIFVYIKSIYCCINMNYKVIFISCYLKLLTCIKAFFDKIFISCPPQWAVDLGRQRNWEKETTV